MTKHGAGSFPRSKSDRQITHCATKIASLNSLLYRQMHHQ